MPFKINPFTGRPDYYEASGSGAAQNPIDPASFSYADDGINAGIWYLNHSGTASYADLGPGNTSVVGVAEMSPGTDGTGTCQAGLSVPSNFGLATLTGSFVSHIHFGIFGLATLTDTYILQLGFDSSGVGAQGLYIKYDLGTSPNWLCVNNNSTQTVVDSGVAVAEGIFTLRIVYDGVSQVDYYLNDGNSEVLLGSVIGNIPTATNIVGGQITQSAYDSVTPILLIDYADFTMQIPGRF